MKNALEILRTKKNLRVIKCNVKPCDKKFMVTVDGGILVQEEDTKLLEELKCCYRKISNWNWNERFSIWYEGS